jgi:hypothetical protein
MKEERYRENIPKKEFRKGIAKKGKGEKACVQLFDFYR